MADSSTGPAHLDPSALGTKEYWDNLYETELSNHAHDSSDTGTVWFDDSDAEAKMVSFLEEHAAESGGNLDPATASVLDLGCGNGSILFALRDEGWTGRLLGVDYSERSVELARAVGVSRREGEDGDGEEEDEQEGEVEFKVWDVLGGDLADVTATAATTSPSPSINTKAEGEEQTPHPGPSNNSSTNPGWDLVLDKGTFDAVSLSGELDSRGRRIFEGYGERVLQLLRPGGLFLVTSCNWTETELREWFEEKTTTTGTEPGTEARLRLAGRVEYPSFSFGGVKGQTISTLCFEKVVA